MKRLRISATMRVAIGLAFVATTVLLITYAIGVMPDIDKAIVDGRLSHCETIAIAASVHAHQDETHRMEMTLRAIADRNDDIQSIAIRNAGGRLIAEIGDHQSHWDTKTAERGSNTFITVPLMSGNRDLWGHVEIRFRDIARSGWAIIFKNPYFPMFLMFPGAMLTLTYVSLRKMLQHMDPSKAVPSRVRSALDTLTSGLLVLDHRGRIALANRAFAESSGCEPKELQGQEVASLPWMIVDDTEPIEGGQQYNWVRSIEDGTTQKPILMALDHVNRRTFLVKCAPIEGEEGVHRGILASFEDVTELKEKELELKRMLEDLTKSREDIRRHNEQLRELAMQDPLTGCMNRRAFFERFEQEWSRASRYGHPLSCILLDLDFFKSINDQFGHAIGDAVLKKVGVLLTETVRDGDFVCRYGGEEFCIGLPHVDVNDAVLAGERIRRLIAESIETDGQTVTASLGVSSISLEAEHPQSLVEQCDKALYMAKREGRNRTIAFSDVPENIEIDESQITRLKPSQPVEDVSIPYHAVSALTSALGYRDAATADHSRRVADLCVAVGSRLMSVGECYILEIAALLHDIGKIGVPDAVLLKPGPLTKEEWEIMGVHDLMGVEIVDSAFNSPQLTEIIQTHHSFFGGKSRHENLPTGKDIPLGSRILCIADTYDAIVSDRVYRKGRSPEEAFAELRRCAGTQFDPDIVEHFIETMESMIPASDDTDHNVNKKIALRIGTQLERLTQAVDKNDTQTLQMLLGRLKLTAQSGGVNDIADLVLQMEQAVDEEADAAALLSLTNELLSVCRSTQRVLLERQPELNVR